MGETTAIAWTDHTLGRTCANCRSFKPASGFARDASRADGLTRWCKVCRNARQRTRYVPHTASPRTIGRRFATRRDGDREQARGRVNYLVRIGILPEPDAVACVDCGHLGDDRRHEYDHHLGYAADHHEHVESVCPPCHARRTEQRGESNHTRDASGRFSHGR